MEVQREAGFCKLLNDAGVETAPDLGIPDLFFQVFKLVLGFREEHQGAAGQADDILGSLSLVGDRFGSFRDFYLPDTVEKAVQEFYFSCKFL